MMESHAEQINRVEMMAAAKPWDSWDLSDNDRAALKTVLADRAALLELSIDLASVKHGEFCSCDDTFRGCPQCADITAIIETSEGRRP